MNKNVKKWAKAAAVRAVRTICQSALAAIGSAAVLGEVDWVFTCSAAALAGVLSVLTSVVTGLPETEVCHG